MRRYSALLLILVFHQFYAQEERNDDLIELEINETIWKPFKESYEARDWKTFNSLHTDDILRAHDRGIQLGKEYKDAIRKYYEREDNRKVKIDFILEKRNYRQNIGYEVGFYRVVYEEEGKAERVSYGRFHVVLKMIDGRWKIAQDWDSESFNGQPIGKADFDVDKILDLND